nr:MAG TPA: hypothetical protein [Bacteriophage sp.]
MLSRIKSTVPFLSVAVMAFPIISCFLEGRSSLFDGTQPPLRSIIVFNSLAFDL